jgi:hypothetical protein
MAAAIPITKSGFGGSAVQAVMWILAPIVTGLGFAAGLKIFELLSSSYKTGFWEMCIWSQARIKKKLRKIMSEYDKVIDTRSGRR